MQHLKALGIKLGMVTLIMYLLVGVFFDSEPFGQILLVSAIITAISYVGDLLMLPRVTNMTATVIDAGLVLLFVFMLADWIFEPYSPVGMIAIMSALFIAAGEWFFHHYMWDHVVDEVDEKTSY